MRPASTYRAAKRNAGPKRVARRSEPETQGNPAEIATRASTVPPEAIDAARSLTIADVDAALERALSKHQETGQIKPMLLNGSFATRARAMGWIEGVEFEEGIGDAV